MVFARLRAWAQRLRLELGALALAARDPRVPWYAKALALAVLAYAASPIDLIPDVIPVLGYLDDVILVPLGIALVLALIPAGVMDDCRARAAARIAAARPRGWVAAAVIVLIWIALAGILTWLALPLLWPGTATAA